MRKIRWSGIALVTQSAMNALDPVYRVGAQIVEAIRTHESCSASAAWERAGRCSRPSGSSRNGSRRYPHEFSGGMRQRAIIAMALALNPPLIIADEPTTALDVIMQDQVFAEIDRIRQERGTALILITHDISLVVGELRPHRRHVCRADRGDGADGHDLRRGRCIPTRSGCRTPLPISPIADAI